jgi:hypothetical protein
MGIKRTLTKNEDGTEKPWTKDQATESTEPTEECPEKQKGRKKKQPEPE